MGESLFFACLKKHSIRISKTPYRVGPRRLCALQRRAGTAELAIAQTVLALICSKPAVLDNTKGGIKIKTQVNTGPVTPDTKVQFSLTTQPSYRRRPVSRVLKRMDSGYRHAGMTKKDYSFVLSL